MPLDDESSSSTHHGMIHCKSISNTSGRRVSYVPVIVEMNGILKSLLFKVKFISSNGITVSQLDAPFSVARTAALLVLSGSTLFTSSSLSLRCFHSPFCCTDAFSVCHHHSEARVPEPPSALPEAVLP